MKTENMSDIVVEALNASEPIVYPKSTTMKVVGDETKLRLLALFSQFTDACSYVKDKINELKEDEKTKHIYDDFVGSFQRGRGCATTIWTELNPDKEYKGKNSFPSKHRGVKGFPFYVPPKTGYNFTTSAYHYSANAAVHTQLDSLNECDKICNNEYIKLKKEVEELDARLRDTENDGYENELVDKFYGFIEKTMAMGWSFDSNFQKFFTQIMLPGLLQGKTIYKGSYKMGDKNKRYSFYGAAVANEIAKHSEYWQIMGDEVAVQYFNANRLLLRKQEHAQYSKTTITKAQVRPFFGNNGIKFSLSTGDDGFAYMTYKLPSLNGAKPENINVKLAYRKVFDGNLRKSCYLDGLTITDNDNGTYVCKYSINGKHPQTAALKECFLRLVIRNNQWFDKMVKGTLTKKDGVLNPSYFDFYVDLSLGITDTPIHNLTTQEVFGKQSIRSYYSSAYPEIKDLGNQESNQVMSVCPIDKPHNLMGVDLGQRNPFAYCIKNNLGSLVATGHLNGSDTDEYKKYIEFGNHCEVVIQVIKETKSYLYGDDEAIDRDNFARANTRVSYEGYLSYLNTRRGLVNADDQSKNQTHTMRFDRTWVIKECVWKLRGEYTKLNKARRTNSDWRQSLYWIDAIYRFIDLQKTFHNFGSYFDHLTKTKINGTGKGFCSEYWEQIDNLNRDTFKKFANALLPIIKQYGVCVVVLEELRSMYGDKLRSTSDNRLYNLWPVGKLKTFLESMLTPYNVAVIEVSEQDTSKIVDGKWAVRNKDDIFNGEKSAHADEEAAKNIVDRALSRHTNSYSLYMVSPLDNYWVASSVWSPKETGGKRLRGFLTKLYGSSSVVFVKQNNRLVKSDLSVKDLKKLAGKKKPANKGYWYRVNDVEWMNGDDKTALLVSLGMDSTIH